jgi:hypothetical protein
MSYIEAISWAAYAKKRGPLNLARRIELGFAMIAALIVNRTGGKASVSDFMPKFGEGSAGDEDEDATLEDVMTILKGARR